MFSYSRFAPGLLIAMCATGGAYAEETKAVNVVNTPLPVTGSLTVTGAVGLAAGTTVKLAPGSSVQIDSTVANPVRVRNVNDAIQPVQAFAQCATTSIGCVPTFYTVPLGKRLVIEYASMSVCGLPGVAAQLTISTMISGAFVQHVLNTAPPASSPGSSAIGCNSGLASSNTSIGQVVRLYADPGTSVLVEGDRADGVAGNASFSFSMSGYLVDVPLTP
jgi:hypothetical protein